MTNKWHYLFYGAGTYFFKVFDLAPFAGKVLESIANVAGGKVRLPRHLSASTLSPSFDKQLCRYHFIISSDYQTAVNV